MQKVIIAVLVSVSFFAFAVAAMAAGGKVQGDKAQGDAVQNCVRIIPDESNICPFE